VVDFTGEIKKPRTILEAALKKPFVEKISAYIEGEEENADLKINMNHLEFDKFFINILNGKVKADIYKLIVVAKVDNEFLTRQILFDWGLEDVSRLIERIEVKNKTTLLEEILRITKINITGEVIVENITNITPTNITNITEVNITNITVINEPKINIKNITKVRMNLSLSTDKKEYNLSETVYIYSNANITRLQIFSDNASFFYTETFEKSMSFAPPMAGDYTIEATVIIDGSIEILAASFSVMPISNISANISLIPSIKELRSLEKMYPIFPSVHLLWEISTEEEKKESCPQYRLECYRHECNSMIEKYQGISHPYNIRHSRFISSDKCHILKQCFKA